MSPRTTITGSILALIGIGMATYGGSQLLKQDAFTYTPNPLGIKRSPYGEVMAMAVQGTANQDFNMVMFSTTVPSNPLSADQEKPTENQKEEPDQKEKKPIDPSKLPFIERLNAISEKRTNPNPPTPGHKRYLRSKIENRLRFAYELDPSHYGNYNSYHLFLTEPELGTSKQSFRAGRDRADALAEETILYCLQIDSTPAPALTAATAAYNILESMFYFKEDYTLREMAEQLQVIDYCLNRFQRLLKQSQQNDTWNILSTIKQNEILTRAQFTQRMRNVLHQALVRLAKERRQKSSPPPTPKTHD